MKEADSRQIQTAAQQLLGLRIDPEMAEYLSKKLSEKSVSIIGGDCKTGVPRAVTINPSQLQSLTSALAGDRS